MTIYQYACMTDSLTKGTADDAPGYSIAQGGQGCWAELVAERLSNLPGVGPLLSSGIRGVWFDSSSGIEWSRAGAGWVLVDGTKAYDKAPKCWRSIGGSSDIQTYRVPTRYRPNVGAAIYWIDVEPSGFQWSYRAPSGTGAYSQHGQTVLNDNKLKKFYLPGAITSIDIRAYDGTNNTNCIPVGIELFYSDPTVATQGLIMHNLGVDGQALHTRMGSTGGDKNAFFDTVTLGTGSPITNTPNKGVFQMDINDVDQINNTTTWNTDLTSLNTRVSPLGPVGFINPYELETGFRPAADQLAYRNQTKTTGTNLAVPVLDIYDILSAKGITGYAATLAANLLISSSNGHPNQALHFYMADKIYWWLRNIMFPTLSSTPSTYTSTGKVASVTATGKIPTAVATAGSLIGTRL